MTPAIYEENISRQRSIAVCGVALRLPGGIHDGDAFWDILVNGKDTRGPIPEDRYNALGFTNSKGAKGAIKTQYGYFLQDDLTTLDTSFFNITKTELERTDPQQRQLLEVTRELFENAGEVNYRGELIGCYVGTFGEDWLQMSAKENQHAGGYIMTGHGDLMLANRLSFEYDLKGPSLVIKTGCSASLVGLHEACRAILHGDCKAAIVAGSNLIMGPTTTAAMTQEGILSPEGSCRTFDAKADGFARGEAISAVYIKDLEEAIRDGNPIRAVIRGTGTNSDGRSQGLMTPSSKAHEALMRKVYADAGLLPEETGFVECHGTGTPTGDPLETTAVGEVFGKSGVYIGSVKPNVGHSEGASGITSLIKAILALEHGVIPPNIKFDTPNPKIPFAEKNLRVPTEACAWPAGRKKRISINSFGIGGSNAHVILDAYAQKRNVDCINGTASLGSQLVLLSANHQDSSRESAEAVVNYLRAHPSRVRDTAYTLGRHREHLPYRSFLTTNGTKSEIANPSKCPLEAPNLVMVFSGQGAQWPQMSRELILSDSHYREDIEEMDSILQSLKHPPSWSLKEELLRPAETSRIAKAELAQPLTTAIQIGLVNRLRRFGVEPTDVVGHSSGEIAAGYAAGALSMTEALAYAYYRGFVAKSQTLEGGMAAVGLAVERVTEYLTDGVVIACDNSPNSVTLSGDLPKLRTVIDKMKQEKPDVFARVLKVDMAYHSHHMKILGQKYQSLLEQEQIGHQNEAFEARFWSSVTGNDILNSRDLGPEYFRANLTSRVCFKTAIQRILDNNNNNNKNNLFLEIGPHSTLAGPLRQTCAAKGTECNYIPSMLREKDCEISALSAVGQLFQQGISIDYTALYPVGQVLTNLPRYSWQHKDSFWYEARVSRDWRLRKTSHHGLLGLRVPESTTLEPIWRNMLSLEDEPWIADHKIVNDIIFPFAGYISMAGEAVRQISNGESGYRIRNATAQSALVLSETTPVELVTALRPAKISEAVDSAWFEFTISSYSGSTWVKHCYGQVRVVDADQQTSDSIEPPQGDLARDVNVARWYHTMADIGIVYGPEFQGLSEIVSATTSNLAAAKVTSPDDQRARFPFHPASIDACLQLLLVAFSKGIGRNFGDLCVPTTIEDLTISQCAPEMHATAWSVGKTSAAVDCMVEGQKTPALRLRGLRLTPLDNSSKSDMNRSEAHAAARLEWAEDFDLADHSKLFDPPPCIKEETWMQEEMTLLCMLETADRLQGLKACQPHFEKFRNWLDLENKRAADGTYPLLGKEAQKFVAMSSPQRDALINELYPKLLKISAKGSVIIATKRIYDNCEKIFTGVGDTLDILMEGDVLTRVYDAVSFGKGRFFRLLCHSRPMLRVLEVGAGTGGTTEMILRELNRPNALPSYAQYTFTDVSAGFFPQAKERFAYAPNMDYRVFDISKSPFDQGFEGGTYDVILAPNVVHATPSLNETLCNLQPLLRPGGLLVLTELCAEVRCPNYIFGNFSGWWLGDADGRPYEPYVSVERWDEELKKAGFSGVDTAVCDAEAPYHYCAAIVSSKPTRKAAQLGNNRDVTVLCDHPTKGIARKFLNGLGAIGVNAVPCKALDIPPRDNDIISLLDLEGHFFDGIAADRFSAFQAVLKNLGEDASILWLLRPTQIKCQDPRSGQAIGVARSIRAESSVPLYTLEISEEEPEFTALVKRVWEKLAASDDNEILSFDKEFAVDEGAIKVGRYQPFSVQEELTDIISAPQGPRATSLQISAAGQLETLQWVSDPVSSETAEGSVLIETKAIGINFKDVLYAMGVLRTELDEIPLGLEVAGVVRSVGSDVKNVSVGDRVLAMPPTASAKTVNLVPAELVQQIPDNLSFDEAASMPICFSTVIESLINLAQLEKGQSVLIHSATGGVGNAAVQISQMIGADIFATVGSEAKVEHLVNTFGIPRERIFSSRNDRFAGELMKATGGRGVDVVLNSLSGELLHASWDCVAEFGKMIELGKKDGTDGGKLGMSNFLLNRSYCCVDMTHLAQQRPRRVKAILQKMVELYSAGQIKPLGPLTVFEATNVQDAFRHVQNGEHIGKAVIALPDDGTVLASSQKISKVKLDAEASYLLTGGLGGLGKPISNWLIDRGARSLVFLSRNAEAAHYKRFVHELESSGCQVTTISGRAESPDDIAKAIAKAPSPIRGIIHLAMVLKDSPIATMSHDDWEAANAPKVSGAWNLHDAFSLPKSLDFFVMASSLVTIVEQPGQGNYSGANTYLEAFCQWRRDHELPASILNICPIDGVGFVAENAFARRNMKAQGLYFLGENEFLDFLELSIKTSQPKMIAQVQDGRRGWKNPGQIVMGLKSEGDLNDPNTRTNWRRDRRMGFYHNSAEKVESDRGGSSELTAFLETAKDDPQILSSREKHVYLATEIGKKIFGFMLKAEDDLDISMTLTQIGLDSLMAIELRRWWKLAFGLEISVLEIMAAGSVESLGALAANQLTGLYSEQGSQ